MPETAREVVEAMQDQDSEIGNKIWSSLCTETYDEFVYRMWNAEHQE